MAEEQTSIVGLPRTRCGGAAARARRGDPRRRAQVLAPVDAALCGAAWAGGGAGALSHGDAAHAVRAAGHRIARERGEGGRCHGPGASTGRAAQAETGAADQAGHAARPIRAAGRAQALCRYAARTGGCGSPCGASRRACTRCGRSGQPRLSRRPGSRRRIEHQRQLRAPGRGANGARRRRRARTRRARCWRSGNRTRPRRRLRRRHRWPRSPHRSSPPRSRSRPPGCPQTRPSASSSASRNCAPRAATTRPTGPSWNFAGATRASGSPKRC